MEKKEIPNAISQVIDEVNRIVEVEKQSELTQLKAENERLKSSLEHVRRCMVGWKSHLHPDLLTLKTIDKILIEHSNH